MDTRLGNGNHNNYGPLIGKRVQVTNIVQTTEVIHEGVLVQASKKTIVLAKCRRIHPPHTIRDFQRGGGGVVVFSTVSASFGWVQEIPNTIEAKMGAAE